MIGLLKAYKESNGHVNVPLDHTAELDGREKPVRLGRWSWRPQERGEGEA